MTGSCFTKVSSSLGNLNPFFLNAQPKSFSSGYRLWHVVQDVWYFRENAGIAWPFGTLANITTSIIIAPVTSAMTVLSTKRRFISASVEAFPSDNSSCDLVGTATVVASVRRHAQIGNDLCHR